MCVCVYITMYACMITIIFLFFSIGIANVSFHWSDSSLALPPLSYMPLPLLSDLYHMKPKTFKEDIRRREDRTRWRTWRGAEDDDRATLQNTESAVAHRHTHLYCSDWSAYRLKRECKWCFDQIKCYSRKRSKHVIDTVKCLSICPLGQVCALLTLRNA